MRKRLLHARVDGQVLAEIALDGVWRKVPLRKRAAPLPYPPGVRVVRSQPALEELDRAPGRRAVVEER